jgi:hypothetical protein
VNPFRKRTVIVLTVVTGVSFLAAILWAIFGAELLPARSSDADTFSRSALGHRAFVELLRELGLPTVVSRFNSGGRARRSALLIVAEPRVGSDQRERMLRAMISQAHRALLVLPKWRGEESEDDPAFIGFAEVLGTRDVELVLEAIGVDAHVVRPPPRERLSWRTGEIGGAVPSIPSPQLLGGPAVRGIVKCDEGTLFGLVRTTYGDLYVLSDPDLLSNHGLRRPGNARAMMGILDLARRDRDAVVIDETLHGFGKEPSLYRSLFEFPLGLATIQALLAAAVLLWAAMGRFGAPHPAAPPFEAGKKALIGNIAALLALGGHGVHALRRYFEGAVAEVRAALHVPPALKAAEADERLDRARTTVRLSDLRALVKEEGRGDRRRILAIALRIHRWREEMIRGRIGGS